jgi:hypothetical protein
VSKKRKKNPGNPAKRPPAHKRVEPLEPEDVQTPEELIRSMQYYAQRAIEVFSDKIIALVPPENNGSLGQLLVQFEDAVRAREAVEILAVSEEEYQDGVKRGLTAHQIFFDYLMGPDEEGTETVAGIIGTVLDEINEQDARDLDEIRRGREEES